MAQLAGSTDALLAKLQNAVDTNDNQWALQLADALIALDEQPSQAKQLKAQALKGLAEEQINATARHYYLTYAHELENEISP